MSFFNNIGSTEIVIIGIILLVLFGGKKLSELARGIGESGRELKSIKKEMIDTYNAEDEVKPVKKITKKKGGVINV